MRYYSNLLMVLAGASLLCGGYWISKADEPALILDNDDVLENRIWFIDAYESSTGQVSLRIPTTRFVTWYFRSATNILEEKWYDQERLQNGPIVRTFSYGINNGSLRIYNLHDGSVRFSGSYAVASTQEEGFTHSLVFSNTEQYADVTGGSESVSKVLPPNTVVSTTTISGTNVHAPTGTIKLLANIP